MNKLVEGLNGVEGIADDFLICSFGANTAKATVSHDSNVQKFLQQAKDRDLKLNLEKVKLGLDSVPFIGHLLAVKGLAPDPNKACSITNMPTPTSVKSLQQLLGMVQYI